MASNRKKGHSRLLNSIRISLVGGELVPGHVVGGGGEQVLRVGREGNVPDPALIFCA